MKHRTPATRSSWLIAATTFVALIPAWSAAQVPENPTPQAPSWYVEGADNRAYVTGRAIDQVQHPEYLVLAAPFWPCCGDVIDPYRSDWAPTRGQMVQVRYPNRYGAGIRAHLWAPNVPFMDPVSGEVTTGPFPAIIVVPGYGPSDRPYWQNAQGLAESGYVVLSFSPQGQHGSDADPSPTETYCDPDGEWRDPQEAGLREQGECAGVPPAPENEAAVYPGVAMGQIDWDLLQESYVAIGPNFVFGAIDAASWLLSEDNPWRGLVDGTRLGVAGHSAGAWGAMIAGNADPRFGAAVVWDGYGFISDTKDPPRFHVDPRVPTLVQSGENAELMSPRRWPESEDRPPKVNTESFRDANIDTGLINLRGSSHQEWQYVPFPFSSALGASRHGQIVAMYYTLAWFDRFLKGVETDLLRGDEAEQRADAFRRLTARAFDASADRTSIGTGRYDPTTGGNVPYTIHSEPVGEHLSNRFQSFMAFDGFACDDWRSGC